MKTILLVGSSIFEAWSSAADVAPGAAVVNRAVGGTITSYWTEQLAAVLAIETPDVVLFYCGSNDINADVTEAEIVANTARCRTTVHAFAPETVFAYFSIIKAPQKLGNWELIDRLNSAVLAGLPAGTLYIETNDVFFPDGSPVERYFVEDGLHLTDEAYETLEAYARPLIADWLALDNAQIRPSPLLVGGHLGGNNGLGS